MFGFPLRYISIALALIGIVATSYFAVSHYNAVLKKNTELEISLKSERQSSRELKDTYDHIIQSVQVNDTNTKTIIERTATIEREIASAPVTHDCVNSPAIQIALGHLATAQ